MGRVNKIKENVAEKENLICGYPIEIYREIFDELSTTELSIVKICDKEERFPSWRTVYKAIVRDSQIGHEYTQARASQFDVLIENLRDEIDSAEPKNRFEMERLKLKAQMMQWAASKLARRKYGDRVAVDIDVDVMVKQLATQVGVSETDFRRVSEKIAKGELDFSKVIEIEASEYKEVVK